MARRARQGALKSGSTIASPPPSSRQLFNNGDEAARTRGFKDPQVWDHIKIKNLLKMHKMCIVHALQYTGHIMICVILRLCHGGLLPKKKKIIYCIRLQQAFM